MSESNTYFSRPLFGTKKTSKLEARISDELKELVAGIAPQDLRAWGHIFQQAAKDGYIRRSDRVFARSLGNGSLAPGWVGV